MKKFFTKSFIFIVSIFVAVISIFVAVNSLTIFSIFSNQPYHEEKKITLYSSYNTPPKHLDPAQCYSSDCVIFTGNLYQTPLQYEFNKTPATLKPDLLTKIPEVKTDEKTGQTQYILTFKSHLTYPQHQAFKHQRFVKPSDVAYQIKRLARPDLFSPVYGIFEDKIIGFKELHEELKSQQKLQQNNNKILTENLYKKQISGLSVDDEKNELIITLKKPYPQFLYWLAMSFFAAVPYEIEEYLLNHKSSLHQNPFGSGAFQMVENKPFHRMVLQRFADYNKNNKNDKNNQLQKLENVEQVIYWKEKEASSYWRKFLQGYYEFSGIPTDFMDQVLDFKNNEWQLKTKLKEQKMNLYKQIEPSVYYLLLNQQPRDVKQNIPQTVRDAIWYGINRDAYNQLFLQGKAQTAYGLIPPNISGFQSAENMPSELLFNPEKAKKIMEKAGYSADKKFILTFDVSNNNQNQLQWFKKQFNEFHIVLDIRSQDWNRLQKRLLQGDFQMTLMGWNADYPDAENFWALLDGANQTIKNDGENKSNYNNPVFNQLFYELRAMPLEVQQNQAQQEQYKKLLTQLNSIFLRDKPLIPLFYPTSMVLSHGWIKPFQTMSIGANDLQYRFIDTKQREIIQKKYREMSN